MRSRSRPPSFVQSMTRSEVELRKKMLPMKLVWDNDRAARGSIFTPGHILRRIENQLNHPAHDSHPTP